MAEILIKNMTLPTEDEQVNITILSDGSVIEHFKNESGKVSSYRSGGVKAIEVPPHGRLIDGDKLERRLKYVACDNCYPNSEDDCSGCSMKNIVNEVTIMTTIIEADDSFAKELKKYDEKIAQQKVEKIKSAVSRG